MSDIAAAAQSSVGVVGGLASTSKPSVAAVVPQEYLVEPGNLRPSPLSGSRDLVTLFRLGQTYDAYLRPYLPPSSTTDASTGAGHGQSKGKAKAEQATASATGNGGGIGITLGGIKIGEVNAGATALSEQHKRGQQGGARRLKMDKNYSYLVQDVPGRNTIKKDHFFRNLVMNPDFQAPAPLVAAAKTISMRQAYANHEDASSSTPDGDELGAAARTAGFDQQTLRDAFTLKAGFPIPGFDMLIWESNTEAPGHKKKKKRKHGADQSANAAGTGTGTDDDGRQKKKRKE
ncbi:hypothetical protein ACM66B_006595 [Microbotryomycetes sp. NB124-2]